MKKFKFLLTLLALVMALCVIVACGNEATTSSESTSDGGTSASDTSSGGETSTLGTSSSSDATTTSTPSGTSSVTESSSPDTSNTTAVTPNTQTSTTAPTSSSPDSSSTTAEPSNPTVSNGVISEGILEGYFEEMPVFYINVNGQSIESKEEYVDGSMSVECTEDSLCLDDAEIEIRLRGNYSLGVEKKSYRIKFAEKTNLLGQGAGPARSWTLLAVYCDRSMIRNAAAFTFAGSLSGIDYTSSARFAKVYLDGEYMGVYQVSEQMQVQEYRVNVDDSETDNDEIGFLVELNTNAGEFPVRDDFGNKYEIKSEVYTDGQYEFIRDCLNDCAAVVWSGNRALVESLIDIDSVIDTYIVEELFKNLDVGWGSFYMYRDIGGKLHFGPVWDFDLAAGNAEPDRNVPTFSLPEYLYVGSDEYSDFGQANHWFIELMQNEWFEDMVRERWDEITQELNDLPAYVRAVAELYSDDFDENFERWQIFGRKLNRDPDRVIALMTHDEQAEYVAAWLEQRIDWLDKYFDGEVPANPSAPTEFKGSGGNGTRQSPYLISTAKDFADFTTAMMYGETFNNIYFRQTADIDMTGYIGYNGIGKPHEFAGTYNGNGYTIHAVIRGTDQCVFPYVTGVVMNVVTTGSVTNTEQAAGITRSVRASGAIVNCMSTMTVTSTGMNAGGIAASNQAGGGIISGCVFAGTLSYSGNGGAINVYMNGDGVYTYNYYLNTLFSNNESYKAGSETAFTAAEGRTLHNVLNNNLTALSGRVDVNQLCRWTAGADGLPAMEHR